MKKGIVEFFGFDPRIPGEGKFRITSELLTKIAKFAPEQKLLGAHCAKEIVECPAVAFLGLRTVDDSFGDHRNYISLPDPDGLCMCGIPANDVLRKARRVTRPGYTFAVFLDNRLTIMDWDWIAESRYDQSHPIGWEHRFGKRIWQRS